MENFNQIIEEAGASTWGFQAIFNALTLTEGLLAGKPAYVFNKHTKMRKENGLKVFREGWMCSNKQPSFYSCLGLMDEIKPQHYYMPTLLSVQGEPKVKFELKVKAWSNWHTFTLLFGEQAFIFSDTKVLLKNPEKIKTLTASWKQHLSQLSTQPMLHVLNLYYSPFDRKRIEQTDPKQMCNWIEELEQFAKQKNCTFNDNSDFPLLAKGLTGFSKTFNARRNMRIAFWQQWNTHRCDLLDFAKRFQSPAAQSQWQYA